LPAADIGEGAVWVTGIGTLIRVDPADPTADDRVTIGGLFAAHSLSVAERVVWVASPTGVARVSASDLDVLRSVELVEPPAVVEVYVAAGSGRVWAVVGDGQLARIDPRTAEITGQVDVGLSATAISTGFGAVWVADDLSGTITRIDPETLELGRPVEVSGQLDDIEAGAGAVWILDSDAGVVTPVDPDSGAVGAPVRVGLEPTDLATGLDSVWVTNNEEGTISRVDPITGSAVETLDVGAPVATIAVDEPTRRIWVVVAELRAG